MKIPSCFFGTYTEAKKECVKVARKLLKGVPLLEAVSAYELIDTKKNLEGAFILSKILGIQGQRHFHLFLISEILNDKTFHKKDLDGIFYQMLEQPWSILGLCETILNWFIVRDSYPGDFRYRWQPFLKKMLEYWDEFWNEGLRYLHGTEGSTLWKASSALWYILTNMGVPQEEATNPQHPENLQALFDKYQVLTMNVVDNQEIAKRFGLNAVT